MQRLINCLILAAAISLPAFAAPLDDAREKGYVVELPTGYIKAQPGAPASIDKLVADINQKRKQAYEKIAEKNNITVEQVGKLSYQKRMSESQQ